MKVERTCESVPQPQTMTRTQLPPGLCTNTESFGSVYLKTKDNKLIRLIPGSGATSDVLTTCNSAFGNSGKFLPLPAGEGVVLRNE